MYTFKPLDPFAQPCYLVKLGSTDQFNCVNHERTNANLLKCHERANDL